MNILTAHKTVQENWRAISEW